MQKRDQRRGAPVLERASWIQVLAFEVNKSGVAPSPKETGASSIPNWAACRQKPLSGDAASRKVKRSA
jgi:hypothetical protein